MSGTYSQASQSCKAPFSHTSHKLTACFFIKLGTDLGFVRILTDLTDCGFSESLQCFSFLLFRHSTHQPLLSEHSKCALIDSATFGVW